MMVYSYMKTVGILAIILFSVLESASAESSPTQSSPTQSDTASEASAGLSLTIGESSSVESTPDRTSPSVTSSSQTVNVDTPLHEALRKGNLIKTKKLLDGGADIDALDSQGATGLILAVKRKDIELIKTLLDYGASTSAFSADGSSPLGVAADAGDIVGVKLLIDRGADAQLVDGNGLSPMMHAVIADDLVVVQLLLDRGARLEGTTKEGKSIGELVKPGGRVSVLPQLPKQVDAAAVAAEHSDSEESSDESAESSSSAALYEPVPERARLTKVRLNTPVGQWQKKKHITLESVQVEARNVGEVAANGVKVTAIVPGGEVVTLEGPAVLERNQSYLYSAKPGVYVTVLENLKAEVSCSNCRK